MGNGSWLDAEREAWRSYVRMNRTLDAHLERHLRREFGLSMSDYVILVNLFESETGRMRAFELGQQTLWEKSRMSHQLSRMEKRGLISKSSHGSRYPEIAITVQGRAAVAACAPAHAALIRRLFVDVFGTDRLIALGELSDQVVETIDKHRISDPPAVRGLVAE